ncbi:hypothetical protein H3147_11270 [Streptomyces sp. OF8]|uniref:histidine kinase n=1 Tax=Streptomyces alkaliterrae TaxID=2213162 RepID=A0A5P0YSJ8_9ACTN|nr:hypothetical protein [Streptomyces alkaliterrae]MQS03265.1 hypothetical protein [Streptomyces alkaliterrae]
MSGTPLPRAESDRPSEVVGRLEGTAVGLPQSGVGSRCPGGGTSHHGEEDARAGRGGDASSEDGRDGARSAAGSGPESSRLLSEEAAVTKAAAHGGEDRVGEGREVAVVGGAGAVVPRGRPEVRFHLSGEPVVLPTPIEVALLRIAQSALGNALSHADAGRVELTLSYMSAPGEAEVALDVVDDGIGFVPEELPPPGSAPDGAGFGLAAMRARAHALHGTFVVESAPDQGTAVAVTFPFSVAEDSGQAV